jgi:pSer/pThr/pTyr-binding forkhead associated (FHA) protein
MPRFNTHILITLLLIALLTLPLVEAVSQAECNYSADLDAAGGRAVLRLPIEGGKTFILCITIGKYADVQITIAPTKPVGINVIVRDPGDRIIRRDYVTQLSAISISVNAVGMWKVELSSPESQAVDIELKYVLPPSQTPTVAPAPAPAAPSFPWLPVVGGLIAIVIILAVVLILMRRPAPPQPPAPATPAPGATQPAPTQPQATTPSATVSGETAVLPATTKETELMVAALELPDGKIVPITSPRQVFGRADFEPYISPELLKYISRKHFAISLEPGGFFIEDLGSTNGTSVNGVDIRGKGKVPIKPGDVIEVGGVIKLKFRTPTTSATTSSSQQS